MILSAYHCGVYDGLSLHFVNHVLTLALSAEAVVPLTFWSRFHGTKAYLDAKHC